jgi:hypothetical protein
MNAFATFAPAVEPRTLEELVSWYGYMNGHSSAPHPDDSGSSIHWSSDDLRELFANETNVLRYDNARRAAFEIADRHWLDVYSLAMGETPVRARAAKAHEVGEHDGNESAFIDSCPVCGYGFEGDEE